MQETDAMDFYQRIVEGTDRTRTIDLEHDEGYTLTGVQMSPVDKRRLASVIERLPEEMFQAVDEAEGDAEQAEENMDGDLAAVTEETVAAFEDLLADALDHDSLTNTQVRQIVRALDFELLFELGTEVINMSVEETGDIRGFHEQD